MLKSNFRFLIFGCLPGNQIFLGCPVCPVHVLVVSIIRTTTILNAANVYIIAKQSWPTNMKDIMKTHREKDES